MAKEDGQLSEAKRAYKNAKAVGNRQEEARWANMIGNLLKNRGEYVEALKWLRIDYEITNKYLPEKQLLATCQSLGEVYLRLQDFKEALIYQKKHLELAKDADDIVEQQRASTQLGRTYHDMFLNSKDDHYSVRNAKKYFTLAMKLAQTLKENPPSKSSFLKEYIDAHNNIGMLEIDLDNLEEAKKILTRGLEICDEEEIDESDDGRSRLHHNLGNVYMELRMWDEARDHIEKDIIICKRIGHCQGEAKGYINLGELHYRVQKYEEAIRCYQKAFTLAKSMEDEDALAAQVDQNIGTVREAMKVMDELKKEEQNLKKIARSIVNARGTHYERKCFLKQNASLDLLIEKSSMIFAWLKHREFAKRKKRIATELCDKEKLGDSFLAIGESYQKLRKFNKAIKWYNKSWDTYKSIGNLEGQALAKINIGNVLDCDGDWRGALNAYEEAYRIADEANLPCVQLSAIENMHYSQMIRFDDIEEARRLQLEIDNLKKSKSRELDRKNLARDCCSETDTDDDYLSDSRSSASPIPEISKTTFKRSISLGSSEHSSDDIPLASLIHSSKHSVKKKAVEEAKHNSSVMPTEASPKCLSKTTHNQQTVVGRKRVRLILSDDEGEIHDEVDCSKDRSQRCTSADIATSDEFNRKNKRVSSAGRFQDISSKHVTSSCNPITVEESICSYKSPSDKVMTPANVFTSSSNDGAEAVFGFDFPATGSKCEIDVAGNLIANPTATNLKLYDPDGENKQYITFKIENDLINVEIGSFEAVENFNTESMKVELACLYYLQLPKEKKSKGLLPIIQHMTCGGRILETVETFENLKDRLGNILIEVSIAGWVQKRLMKLYVDCCNELSETPNMRLLQKLYISEIEDEVIASECELQDISITPLLNALNTQKGVAMLDLSHNLLGNGTMEKLEQFFTLSQRYGDLTLDLHCNRFGPTALFQICECPVLFARLEVLNISGNRLTDACGSYLSTILENCKALYSLNIERCSITTRTIQKVADALNASSSLTELWIGYNNPVSGNALINLLDKLAIIKGFAVLNLNGLKLNKVVIDSLCRLVETVCVTQLMLGSTGIGTDGALQLTKSLFNNFRDSMKLDLSHCGLTTRYLNEVNSDVICGAIELNLEGNPILQEGRNALTTSLMNLNCCLKVLILNNCELGDTGVLQIMQAVAENHCLEELHLAENISLEKNDMLPYEPTEKRDCNILQPAFNVSESTSRMCTTNEAYTDQQNLCAMHDCNHLEVADSEDAVSTKANPSELDDSCTSSCQKNSSLDCQYIKDLSTALAKAKQLRFLDLSNNGFPTQIAKALYITWSTRSGTTKSWQHIKGQIIHFSVETNKCCRSKPCCRRD